MMGGQHDPRGVRAPANGDGGHRRQAEIDGGKFHLRQKRTEIGRQPARPGDQVRRCRVHRSIHSMGNIVRQGRRQEGEAAHDEED